MPTLFQRMGPTMADALAKLLVRCRIHGPSPWVPICRCVLEGAPPGEASPSSVLCDDHLRLAAEGHPGADEDVDTVCLTCLIDRGILS